MIMEVVEYVVKMKLCPCDCGLVVLNLEKLGGLL